MDVANVTFKGTVNGLTIILKEEDDFKAILKQIEKKVQGAGKFFKGATLHVKYKGKNLTAEEETRVFELLSTKSGAKIESISKDREESGEKEGHGQTQPQHKIKMNNFYFKGIDQGPAKFYRGTVRSGQLISYEGNLVVIGDVNPGGEVIATGNIIVMGSLRGMVHAGADGNKEAIVVAFNLQPTQLRIADVITRSPDEKEQKNTFIPELAYVKEDIVYIERYLPQR